MYIELFCNLSITFAPLLAIYTIRPGGGRLRGPDDQTNSYQSETWSKKPWVSSMMPKLCDFYYLSFRHKGSGAIFLVEAGGGGALVSRLKLQREYRMLKTPVLCFTLHLLEKVGGYPPAPPPMRHVLTKLQNFSKTDQSKRLLLLISHQDVPKIYKVKKFSSAWKLLKLTWGCQFWVEKNDFGHKNSFLKKLNPFSGVNSRI